MTDRYCPNCDRLLDHGRHDNEVPWYACQHCDIAWTGHVVVGGLPTSPIGDELREKSFEHAKFRAGLR